MSIRMTIRMLRERMRGTTGLWVRRRFSWAGMSSWFRGEPMRAKFRDSWEKPTPLTPGKMVSVNAEMPDINHTFRAGHRIMVQVQSSWFPLVDRNPQTFVDIPLAKPEQFVKATESVYRSADAASGVEVLVVPRP